MQVESETDDIKLSIKAATAEINDLSRPNLTPLELVALPVVVRLTQVVALRPPSLQRRAASGGTG